MYTLCFDICFHFSQVNAAKILGTQSVSSHIPFDPQTCGLLPDPMGWTWLGGGPQLGPSKVWGHRPRPLPWTKPDITAALSTDYFEDTGNTEIFFFFLKSKCSFFEKFTFWEMR